MTQTWQTDDQFQEHTIKEVRKAGAAYVLTTAEGWSLGIGEPDFEPQTGQTVRYYGKGIGFPVRGVVIDGRLVYYKTEAEQDVEEQERSARWGA